MLKPDLAKDVDKNCPKRSALSIEPASMVPSRSIANEAEAGKIPLEIQSVPLRSTPAALIRDNKGRDAGNAKSSSFGQSVIHIGQDWNAQIVELLQVRGEILRSRAIQQRPIHPSCRRPGA